jgi:hypothetical protein
MISQKDYNLEIAKLVEPTPPPIEQQEYLSIHPFMASMSPGGGWYAGIDTDATPDDFALKWFPHDFMLSTESALAAFDQIFGKEGLELERFGDDFYWYAYDQLDESNFGAGKTIAEAICELILRKKGFEVEDH